MRNTPNKFGITKICRVIGVNFCQISKKTIYKNAQIYNWQIHHRVHFQIEKGACRKIVVGVYKMNYHADC